MAMTDKHARDQCQVSLGSKVRVDQTDRQTDGAIALPPVLTRSLTIDDYNIAINYSSQFHITIRGGSMIWDSELIWEFE